MQEQDHLWLNEGWATYSEVLWREERARQEAIRDGLDAAAAEAEAERAMLEYMLQLVRVQRRFNRAHAPLDAALSSNLYEDPETTFERPDDPYNKGAAVLHMIRGALGDDLFQRAAREYVRRHRDGLVETDDLRRCIEDVSGRSFERFFAHGLPPRFRGWMSRSSGCTPVSWPSRSSNSSGSMRQSGVPLSSAA